jgi:hypothetical protein
LVGLCGGGGTWPAAAVANVTLAPSRTARPNNADIRTLCLQRSFLFCIFPFSIRLAVSPACWLPSRRIGHRIGWFVHRRGHGQPAQPRPISVMLGQNRAIGRAELRNSGTPRFECVNRSAGLTRGAVQSGDRCVTHGARFALLVSERFDGADLRRATCGDVARGQADSRQQRGRDTECQRIERWDAEQQTHEQPARCRGQQQTDR